TAAQQYAERQGILLEIRIFAPKNAPDLDEGTRWPVHKAKFAADIDMSQQQLSNMLSGKPLSRKSADAIVRRFPVVSRDFLFDGLPGRGDAQFEQKLLEWQHQNERGDSPGFNWVLPNC